MDLYRIEWKKTAIKELRSLPKEGIRRILEKVEALRENPFPKNARKLVGSENLYRLRVGRYRVIYEVREEALIIFIIKVAHRREAYRKF